ncbi:MAG: sigma-54 dependent transcriptional regulator [Kofleriaceae bacterium]
MDRETLTVAVCGTSAPNLEHLAEIVAKAGRWGVVPIHWPNVVAWEAARGAHLYVVDSGALCDELVENLRKRAASVPLVAIGAEPIAQISPDVWLPSAPPATLLGSLLGHLLEGRQEDITAPIPSWRRKSDMIIGNSAQLRQLRGQLDQLAAAQTPVLITGESGVGKELVARSLHFCGPRAKDQFVAINCAAIPESLFESELFGYMRGAFTGAINAKPGAFELAHNGTLFLDEIGELPLALQAKLLRVLETSEVQRIGATEPKQINLRLVTATNRELEKEIEAGRFREDLYYRIHVYPVHVPPLRERAEDIAPIVAHQLSTIARRENRPALRLTAAALEKLVGYPWPGNVRELVNLLERAILLAPDNTLDAEHIAFASATPAEPAAMPIAYREAKTKFELEYFSQLLRMANGNISLAAKLGQKTRKEIYDALKRLELDPGTYRNEG